MIPVDVCGIRFPIIQAEALTRFGTLETGTRIVEILRIVVQTLGNEHARPAREFEAKNFGPLIQTAEKHRHDNVRLPIAKNRRLLAAATSKIPSDYRISVPGDA